MIPTQLTKKTIYRGDNEEFSLKFETEVDGVMVPYDLNTWHEIKAQFRLNDNHYSFLATELTTLDGGLEIAGDNNERLIIHLKSANTEKFNKAEVYNYDIKFVGGDGEAKTMLTGELEIILNVTNK